MYSVQERALFHPFLHTVHLFVQIFFFKFTLITDVCNCCKWGWGMGVNTEAVHNFLCIIPYNHHHICFIFNFTHKNVILRRNNFKRAATTQFLRYNQNQHTVLKPTDHKVKWRRRKNSYISSWTFPRHPIYKGLKKNGKRKNLKSSKENFCPLLTLWYAGFK